MAYQPIENYGIIGDLHTAALVGMNGSIDWLCLPRFDAPSVFAAILDDRCGGRCQIAPATEDVKHKQFYWPDTNVLVTRFLYRQGVAELVDYMPVAEAAGDRHDVVRRVTVVRGEMAFRMVCRPAFNYARDAHEVQPRADGVTFESATLSLGLSTRVPLQLDGQGGAAAEFTLHEGETAVFLLQQVPRGADYGNALGAEEEIALFRATVRYWRRWIAGCTYKGRWREIVYRSALVLKLLTYEPTGAIVAAPTCSLPELAGGGRNWDYRYTWIRDAAFTVYALMRIGFIREAARFMGWIEARCHELDPEGFLQVMYGIDGKHALAEETLDHLEGYRASRPVRIGNGAYDQLQLDIYGELMDSVYLYNKYGSPIAYDLWKELRRQLNWVCDHWRQADHGIWEVRGKRQHFVYSKVMCWVALDRGLRLADKRSFPVDHARWRENRDAIYEQILSQGWSDSLRAFTQYYGSETLDAANLILPLVFFISPSDPRMLDTLRAISRPTDAGGLSAASLVYRYHAKPGADGLEGDEGTFNMCTFWLVEAMTRAGRADRTLLTDAELLFETMRGYANHLGLYGEQTGPSGEALGNFPQAFTHLALISAAFNLERALSSNAFDWPGVPRLGS
jgi:GH15 family glucan-1,4-alpha-glucosidase